MGGYGYNGIDDDDEDEDFQSSQGDGPAGLRAAYRKQEKELAKLRKELEERDAKIADLSTKSRAQSLSEILRSKQVNPKLADLIPASIDATEEAVGAFLEQYKELFPVTPPKPEAQPQPNQGNDQLVGDEDEELDDEALALKQAYDAYQAAMRGAQPNGTPLDVNQKLEEIGTTAKSFDEVAAALNELPGFKVSNYNS